MDDQLSVTRATGVLNAAMKHGMLPEGSIPESDGDKVIEAEKMIELAKQAYTVAQQIGKGNVPQYEGIMDVLSEAEVFLGIGSAEHEAAAQQPPSAPAPSGGGDGEGAGIQQSAPAPAPEPQGHIDVIDTPAENKRVYVHEGCDGGRTAYMVPLDDVPPPAIGSVEECANCAYQVPIASHRVEQPAPPAPTPEPSSVPAVQPPGVVDDDPTDAQPREMWLDQHGTPVEIVAYAGGPQVQIKFASGEETVVPIGFLKQRAQVAQEPASSSTSPQEQQPPSSPQPPPSTPPIASPVATPPAASSSPPSEAGTQASPAPLPPSPSEPPSTPSLPEAPPVAPKQDTGPVDNDDGDPEYRKMLDDVEANYSPSGFPTPMDLSRPPEDMPEDLTAVSDLEARRLHSQFNALAARARFLHGLESAKARGCERIRKAKLKEPLQAARAELGKGATLTEAKLLAEQDEEVAIWIAREDLHKERAEAYRTFLSFYSEDVSVLSRDWTMRANEEAGS